MEDTKHEEVDMIFILRSIKNGLYNAFKFVVWLLEFSIQKIHILLIFLVLGGALTMGIYLLKRPYYTNQITLSHSRFDNDYCFEMITNLNSYLNSSSNNQQLAKKLNISTNIAKEVKSFKYLLINNNIARRFEDSVGVMLPFKVEVEVYNNSILDSLQTGILYYLENNEYALLKKAISKLRLEDVEKKLDLELQNIEFLKQQVDKSVVPQSTGNGIILGAPINPVIIYETAMKLYERKLDIQERKKLNDSFYVIIGFAESKKTSFDVIVYLEIGLSLSYLFGILYLLRRRHIKLNGKTVID